MTTIRYTVLTLSVVLLWAGPRAQSQEAEKKLAPDVQKAQQQLEDHLKKVGSGGPPAQISLLGQEPMTQLFPDHYFFAARYRIYPVARALPKGMRAANVFVVSRKNDDLIHVKDVADLQSFFSKNLAAVKDEKSAKAALKASLVLAQEFRQDGMFKFSIMDETAKVDDKDGGKQVSGKAVVMQGGNGEMQVTLTFDAAGKLANVSESGKIRAGPRPICQATKLLDADPIVRRMAEQDLLIMGLAAHAYLMEQRDQAGPELRRAIDRLWRQIVEAGW